MQRKKRISEQVIVITGASSGIGLASARLAARRGARVVMSSFDERPLREAADELRADGHAILAVVADVAEPAAMERLASEAVQAFGRIDTWVNNAGVHIFGRSLEVDETDARRLIEVDYFGTVHGSTAALPHLRASAGTLINVGSVLSARSVPLQGIYGASKHAVKAWTDALRMELAMEGSPVAVTLVQPAAIHTPIVRHSRSLLDERTQLPPPMYAPEVAARAIVRCAERPPRSIVIGGVGVLAGLGEKFGPKTADEVMRLLFFRLQRTKGKPRARDALHTPLGDRPRATGKARRVLLRHSTYTWARLHPGAALAGAALLAAGLHARGGGA